MNLTNDIRNQIRNKILNHRFKAEEEALAKKKCELGLRIYNMIYPKALRDTLSQVPEGYLVHATSLKVGMHKADNYKGWNNISAPLPHSLPIPVAIQYGSAIKGFESRPLVLELDTLYREEQKQTKAKVEAQNEIDAFLCSYTTRKKLLEGWPEAAFFVPDEPVKNKALVVAPATLNDKLKPPVKKSRTK